MAGPRAPGRGDTAQAARLLTWHEAIVWYEQHRLLTVANNMFEPVALFERAKIDAALGRTEAARARYEEFLRRYDMARGDWALHLEEALVALQKR